ncbi:Uncharacterised protein [uncultured archaeon]|nr:Uncharacterised protein [uncultured archaeon]
MQPTCGLKNAERTFAKQVAHPFGLPSANCSQPSRCPSISCHLRTETVYLVRFALVITLALLVLCISADSLSSDRPETGTTIKDMNRDGNGLLTIHNNWTMDTVAVLTNKWTKPLLVVYLRSKDSLDIEGIPDGKYSLYFTVGDQWNGTAGRFNEVYGYYRYSTPLEFETTDSGSDIEYSIYELDLYKADASNFMPDHFQFPDIRS